MAAAPRPVFVVTLEAVEALGGPRLTVLAFVEAADGPEAETRAGGELAALGWSAIRALRHGEVIDEAALPADFRGAMADARRYGCGLIIYEEP